MSATILRGVPYSGKSTIARLIKNVGTICSADDFHRDGDGNYNFNPGNARKAHIWCFQKFLEAVSSKEDRGIVVADNTNVRLWEASPYYAAAEAYGHDVRVINVTAPLEVLYERHKARKGQHVPFDVVLRMLKDFEKAPPWWICEELNTSNV